MNINNIPCSDDNPCITTNYETDKASDNNDDKSESVSNESIEYETWIDNISEKSADEIEETILELMEEYIYGTILKMSYPKYQTMVCSDITAYLFGLWVDSQICENTDEDYLDLERFVRKTYVKYMEDYCIIPVRQTDIHKALPPINASSISEKLMRLYSIEQPKQRTPEWYKTRYNMITASNISKALGSEASRNSLIYEKCKPLVYADNHGVNTESSMHWGVKYEPITAMIYESMFSAKIADFGCIPHSQYPFIGASPDGIIVDPFHPRYGHMIEIKNIVNREITGIPKEEYWIQMQVQMGTCDLDYCDFIETRIKEYENQEQYMEDTEHTYKGIVLYFVKKMLVTDALPDAGFTDRMMNAPYYVYMPLSIPVDRQPDWIREKREELKEDYVLYRTDYWYLEKISCVLVERNHDWFQSALPCFIELWQTILKERIEGYAHRAANKKPKIPIMNANIDSTIKNITLTNHNNGICLVKLDM